MRTKRDTVTAKQVAELAGVSQSTVSMILNNYENASFTEVTRQKVLDACNTLGYTGFYQKDNHERTIFLIVPSLSNLSYVKQVTTAQQRAMELGYTCLIFNTFRNTSLENNILTLLQTIPVSGVVFLYQPENLSLLQRAGAIKPTVAVCDRNLDLKMDNIEVNSYGIGKIIAEHMISQGHTNVMYIATDISPKYITRLQRLEGIKGCYRDHGFDAEHIKICTLKSENISTRGVADDYKAGVILIEKALTKYGDTCTGIIGYNDMICFGIIDAMKQMNLSVPGDYSIIGCDNIYLTDLSSISLTSVEHYAHLRARDAVELLLRKIKDNYEHSTDVSTTGITRVEYEPKIIIRSSTRNIRRHHQ
ncbi:MAG: LacI family DNA-binding transcriptional regulator [Clostridia bacterium]|nr:LacI family DNA-binding transcriptional regulator [Clostridia bacterium]